MFPVRLSKRECTDQQKIADFLKNAQIGYLGLSDREAPYVVPLNFVWLDGSFCFHGADAGRKMEIMSRNKAACLTISEHYGTITNPVPAHTDSAYMSVMAFGQMEIVEDLNEATAIMQGLLDKYVPGYYDKPLSRTHVDKHRSSMGGKTTVFKLVCSTMSAKVNETVEGSMFERGARSAE